MSRRNAETNQDPVTIAPAIYYLESARRELLDFSPCGSPIEDIFYRTFQKYRSYKVAMSKKFEAAVGRYTFHVDFLLRAGPRLVGIECDGKSFRDPPRQSWRDAQIVGAGLAHVIYRLLGRDIVYHIDDALDLIRVREPHLFSERGHANVAQLATRESERRDEPFYPESGFPFAVARWYERGQQTEDCDGDSSLMRPTVVYWTE